MKNNAPVPVLQSLQSVPQLANKVAQTLREVANGWFVEELRLPPREIDLNARDVVSELDHISADSCQPSGQATVRSSGRKPGARFR